MAKAATRERCFGRVRREHARDHANITDNQRKQDAVILDIERACAAWPFAWRKWPMATHRPTQAPEIIRRD